ncbi:MAG: 1,4-alpha-glucan branching enzyme, partial [Thermoprotei archaeon]
FAPTARYGDPAGLMALIDACHRAGLGVILDWVPAHFPKDEFGLYMFDGTHLYNHADKRKGEHPDWGTLIFNYSRNEVKCFLISSALFWAEKYHADGLRLDAVSSMLYLDYSRKPGQWIPNEYGGNENLEAIAFLRQLNNIIHSRRPGFITVAEESTAWPGVTKGTESGGLGFDFKWNMGWMHDTLEFFRTDPIFRKYDLNKITFSLWYAFSERFLLPLSHDEVVYGKGSLYAKMPGDAWKKFANLRLLLAYMFGHPGKKLLFMGAEFAQSSEWNVKASLNWAEAQNSFNKGVARLLQDLNRLYGESPALHESESDPACFEWVDFKDSEQTVIVFNRFSRDRRSALLFAFNFTPVPRFSYRVGVPAKGFYREVLNTDSELYGGTNLGNYGGTHASPLPAHGKPWSVSLTLPPLAAVVLEVPFDGRQD